MSPTQRSLKKWREAGYLCAVVEKWNPHSRIRQDLYGIIDILATGNGETVGIQCTTYSAVSARVKKINDSPETVGTLKGANWRIIVEGWHKKKNERKWSCREVII